MSGRIALVVALSASAAGCARAPTASGPAASASVVCANFSFPVYFEVGSVRLTSAAARVVLDSAARVKGCKLGVVDVIGLADADGGQVRNRLLAKGRADAVASALAAAGLPVPKFEIESLGESGATTPSGRDEPLRRRTEVIVRAQNP